MENKPLNELGISRDWTLFLDRDGTINKEMVEGYVLNWGQFIFNDGSLQAIKKLSYLFGHTLIVTNQRPIAINLMTEDELNKLHESMMSTIRVTGGNIDKIYFCPHDRDEGCDCRKPNTGMAHQAKYDYPDIDFKRSVIVGNTDRDINFGGALGMLTILISENEPEQDIDPSYRFGSLLEFAEALVSNS